MIGHDRNPNFAVGKRRSTILCCNLVNHRAWHIYTAAVAEIIQDVAQCIEAPVALDSVRRFRNFGSSDVARKATNDAARFPCMNVWHDCLVRIGVGEREPYSSLPRISVCWHTMGKRIAHIPGSKGATAMPSPMAAAVAQCNLPISRLRANGQQWAHGANSRALKRNEARASRIAP